MKFLCTLLVLARLVASCHAQAQYGFFSRPAISVPFFNDTFTGADGANLALHTGESGAAWTLFSGSGVIYQNRARSTDAANLLLLKASAWPASADYSISAVLHYFAADATLYGVAGRCDHATDNYYLACYTVGSGWQLFKKVSGSFTALGTSAATLTAGNDYTMTLDMVGTTIRVVVDGVEKISVTDSALAGAGVPAVVFNASSVGTGTGIHLDRIYGDDGVLRSFSTAVSFVLDGDSLMTDYGRLGSKTVAHFLGASTGCNTDRFWNFAVAGQTMASAIADGTTQVDPIFPSTAGFTRRLAICNAGINDIDGASSTTILSRIRSYASARVSAGFAAVMMTLPKAGTLTADQETIRQAVNSGLVSDHSAATYFVDIAADAAFSDPADTTYYQSDTIHWTTNGAARVAALIKAVVTP